MSNKSSFTPPVFIYTKIAYLYILCKRQKWLLCDKDLIFLDDEKDILNANISLI
jgi:hypothetical protein